MLNYLIIIENLFDINLSIIIKRKYFDYLLYQDFIAVQNIINELHYYELMSKYAKVLKSSLCKETVQNLKNTNIIEIKFAIKNIIKESLNLKENKISNISDPINTGNTPLTFIIVAVSVTVYILVYLNK